MKSGVHTTVGGIHTGRVGMTEVREVKARFRRSRRGARKFGVGVKKAGIHTEIADFTGVTQARVGSGGRSRPTKYNISFTSDLL